VTEETLLTPSLKERVRAFYDEYHRQRLRSPDQYWLHRIWGHFHGRVLEVGVGRLFWPAATSANYVVADLSAEAMGRAHAAGHNAFIADGEGLPFADHSFDTVVCHDVLEHVVNPEPFVREMVRVSRERVVVAGPNYIGPDNYAMGIDRYLPLRILNFVCGPGRGCHRLTNAHLQFDGQWQPDADAITAANSWWVAQTLHKAGCRRTHVETWPQQEQLLNRVPIVQHLGPFMVVVATHVGAPREMTLNASHT